MFARLSKNAQTLPLPPPIRKVMVIDPNTRDQTSGQNDDQSG